MKSIAKVWTFRSSSSDRTYQTLLYINSTTSCDCPGWTRRTDSNGKRTCRHTRSVELGNADTEAINFFDYTNYAVAVVSAKAGKLHTPILSYGTRKLCI